MNIEERFVAAVMGAIWGAFLGVLLALLLYGRVNSPFTLGALFNNFTTVIFLPSALFAALGLIFKASVGTWIGVVMNWLWALITGDAERGLLSEYRWWIKVLVIGVVCLGIYSYVKN